MEKLAAHFAESGLPIEDFIVIMKAGDHRLKPDGLHTGKGRGGDWNREWEEFSKEFPARNTREHQDRIKDKLEEMKKRYKVDEKTILLPPKTKTR